MARQFDIGRQSEALMNQELWDQYKYLEYLNNIPRSTVSGPTPDSPEKEAILNGSLWLDKITSMTNADLKYFNNGVWNLLFADRFKITGHLLDEEEPLQPIPSQLWIDNNGVMRYYDKGEFKPIKATVADIGSINPQGFEDFIIINPLEHAGSTVIDNFSQYLFLNTPIVEWDITKSYSVQQGCIHDMHIYICRKDISPEDHVDISNKEHWTRLDFLNQFLVPNAEVDKFFIDGHFIHQKVGMTIMGPEGVPIQDPKETGYKQESNVCVSFPIEMIEGKKTSAVHVNPKRLHNITKKFIRIDKENPVIEIEEENTEFYGIQGGIGRLLLKTDDQYTTDYISAISSNIDCIKLTESTARSFDFIYAIHYSFADSKVKEGGTLYKKKIKLKDENYIWIDKVDPSKICVFAQGLYYEEDEANYWYDYETGYLYIREKLQDYQNLVKRFDFSVLYFPAIHRGRVNHVQYDEHNYFPDKGYRICIGEHPPKSKNMLAFLKGVQMNIGGQEVIYDPSDPTAIFIPSLTKEFVDANGEVYWCVAETDEYDINDEITHSLLRGRTKAIRKDPYGIVVPIYRDKENPVEGALYLDANEAPILFVDGVLTFQKEISVSDDHITIYGLKEGQDVVMLGDTNSANEDFLLDGTMIEFNSDRVLFEDSISYATIPTEMNDSIVVYLQNGILTDASAVYSSIEPKDEGANGEVRYCVNYTTDKWVIFNGKTGKWEEISPTETVLDPNLNREVPYIDILDKNSRGYSATRKSISFLQNLGEEYCTYYAYKYSDSIEKKLLMGYCYPNGEDGINNPDPKPGEPNQFKCNFKHYYTPGRNEISVYWNGIRQNLDSPYDINFENSKVKECRLDKNNEFVFAFDDKTKRGQALKAQEGYFTYYMEKPYHQTEAIALEREMTDEEKRVWTDKGYTVNLASRPTRNTLFYVIERCEGTESKACEKKVLTFKDSLAHTGAFSCNAYTTGDFILTRGNIRVFVNGYRQPFGAYQTLESIEEGTRVMRQAYNIVDSRTIQFQDPLIGGFGGNQGNDDEPRFEIGTVTSQDGTVEKKYYEVIDEILIETRRDFKLREITIPIKDNTGEFTAADGIPLDMFKTKDKIMIYINGLAYGKEYTIENNTIKLLNEEIKNLIGNNKTDVITFEWR